MKVAADSDFNSGYNKYISLHSVCWVEQIMMASSWALRSYQEATTHTAAPSVFAYANVNKQIPQICSRQRNNNNMQKGEKEMTRRSSSTRENKQCGATQLRGRRQELCESASETNKQRQKQKQKLVSARYKHTHTHRYRERNALVERQTLKV